MTTLIMSFARTGLQAMSNAQLMNKAVSENSWDPNKLIKESMKARSAEKQAAARADASVDVGRSKNRMTIAKAEFEVDKFNMQQDMKKSTRKAGIIAAAGQTIATGLIKKPDPKKPYQSDSTLYDGVLETQRGHLAELDKMQTKFETDRDAVIAGRKTTPGVSADPTSSTPGTLPPAAPMSASGKFVGGSLNPTDALAIKSTAGRLGVDPYSLGGLFEMESGHRPNVWGGDGGNYKGLIQFGPGARSEVGLPDRDMSISEQLPYVEKYFNQRGFTPGKHGVTEMYRTVLSR